MVGLVQAFGAFRGAMTLIGIQVVTKVTALTYKNQLVANSNL